MYIRLNSLSKICVEGCGQIYDHGKIGYIKNIRRKVSVRSQAKKMFFALTQVFLIVLPVAVAMSHMGYLFFIQSASWKGCLIIRISMSYWHSNTI